MGAFGPPNITLTPAGARVSVLLGGAKVLGLKSPRQPGLGPVWHGVCCAKIYFFVVARIPGCCMIRVLERSRQGNLRQPPTGDGWRKGPRLNPVTPPPLLLS